MVELRAAHGRRPAAPDPGEVLRLPGGVRLRVLEPHPAGQRRLWRTRPLPAVDRVAYLAAHGRPIRYAYVEGDWPMSSLQNVYATHPGSAEMPSAGRPLTEALLVRLVAAGIPVAPVLLHTGVASQEKHEPPQPEQLVVPEVTARLVNATVAAGRRVVAVGTTAVRALESAVAGRRVVPTARLDEPGAGTRPAGPGGDRAAHRAARAGGQPPRPARGRRRSRPGRPGVRRRHGRGGTARTSGTSSATPCCCSPDPPAHSAAKRASRSASRGSRSPTQSSSQNGSQ